MLEPTTTPWLIGPWAERLRRWDRDNKEVVGSVLQGANAVLLGVLTAIFAAAKVGSIPLLFLFYWRYWFALVLFSLPVIWHYWVHGNFAIIRTERRRFHLLRGLAQVCNILCAAVATQNLQPGQSSGLALLGPVCIVYFGGVWHDPPTKAQRWCCYLAAVAACLVIFPDSPFELHWTEVREVPLPYLTFSLGDVNPLGLLSIAGALWLNTYQAYKGQEARVNPKTGKEYNESKFVMMFWPLLPAVAITTILRYLPLEDELPFFAYRELRMGWNPSLWNASQQWTATLTAGMVAICLLTTVMALSAAKRCTQAAAANLLYLQPVVHVSITWTFLGQPPFQKYEQWLGAVSIVVVGVVVSHLSRVKNRVQQQLAASRPIPDSPAADATSKRPSSVPPSVPPESPFHTGEGPVNFVGAEPEEEEVKLPGPARVPDIDPSLFLDYDGPIEEFVSPDERDPERGSPRQAAEQPASTGPAGATRVGVHGDPTADGSAETSEPGSVVRPLRLVLSRDTAKQRLQADLKHGNRRDEPVSAPDIAPVVRDVSSAEEIEDMDPDAEYCGTVQVEPGVAAEVLLERDGTGSLQQVFEIKNEGWLDRYRDRSPPGSEQSTEEQPDSDDARSDRK